MEQPLVSIVLPTYNGAAYLAKSIQSCIDQTYRNFELIIVDDNSSDATPEIIRSFVALDPRISSTRNSPNQKLPRSLNTGFERAKGKYFTWTSDDNYYAPNALEVMVQALEQNPDRILTYANYTFIDENGTITGTKSFGDVNESMVTWHGAGACFLYHADVHTRLNGYDPSAFLIEDYDFFIRALTLGKFHYLDRTDLYFYRHHSQSLSSLYGFYNFDLQKIVVERRLKQLLEISSPEDKQRWLRKFAVYYGVTKSNHKRMNSYLQQLYTLSKSQTILTVGYIIVQKTIKTIGTGFSALWQLIRLFTGGAKAA